MKYFSFVLVLFIAQLTFAQTKTGSGGGLDERDNFEALFGKDVLYNEIGSNPKGFDKLKFGTSPNAQFQVDLSSVLHFQNEICREKKQSSY